MIAPPLDVLPAPALHIGDAVETRSSGRTHQHVYAATGEPTREVPLASATDVDRAVTAARAAFPAWRRLPVDERRRLLNRVAELLLRDATEIGTICTLDNGTPGTLTAMAAHITADLFAYNAGWADKIGGEVIPTWPIPALDYALHEPYGVVGVIIPWNGPLISVGMTCAPALAAGNCLVIKPPELAPWSVLKIAELFREAGFPPGVVNVLPGGPDAGAALVGHGDVDKVHFTGSGATAKHILESARQTLKPVGLELGGKSANIICADADLEAAVEVAVSAITVIGSGQGCINGTRILVERSVYEPVIETITTMANLIPQGDPFAPTTMMGPVVDAKAEQRILGVIETAKQEGARLVTGGNKADGELADGYFIRPTVFADVDNRSDLGRNEVFGPVLAVMPFEDDAGAVATANDTSYGLAAYLFTKDLGRAHRLCAALDAGNIWVNGFTGIPAGAPFGGVKQSGYGRLGGIDGIREFTRPKNVWISLA